MTEEQMKAAEQRIADQLIMICIAGILLAAVLITVWEHL